MGTINGRDAVLALPEKEILRIVLTKLDDHEERHDGHDKNFLECDRKFQSTINEIRSVSDTQAKAIKTHAAESARRHQELMAQHGELLDKLSLVIAFTENSKRGAGFVVWLGGAIKKIATTIKDFIFVFVIIALVWNIYTKTLDTDQLAQIAAKFMGGK